MLFRSQEASELSRTGATALADLGTSLLNQHLLIRLEKAAGNAEQDFGDRIAAADADQLAEQDKEQELRIAQVQTGEVREGLARSIKMHEEALRDFERALQEIVERQQQAEDDRAEALAQQESLLEMAGALEDSLAELTVRKETADEQVQTARGERERVLQMFVIATLVSIGLSLVLASTDRKSVV